MEDPVILPNSRMSIDRATIRSHLLSDPHDPFNRVPLTMEDVIPGESRPVSFLFVKKPLLTITDTELKAKIEAFKAERTGRKPAPEQMDTSSG